MKDPRKSNPGNTNITKVARLTRAYSRLQVSPNEVAAAPKATPFLRRLPGGIPFAISILRGSAVSEARRFMTCYDDITLSQSDRNALPFEAFCVAANVCPSRMKDVVVAAIARQQSLEGAAISALAHSDIVRTNTAMALLPDMIEDRMAHLKIMGSLPIPKSAQTSVTVNASAQSTSTADAKSLSTSAPPPEDTIRRIIESRQQRQLPSPSPSQPALPETTTPDTVPMFMPTRAREPAMIDTDYIDADD